MSRKERPKDWPYPPNYNHLLGYVEKGVAPNKKRNNIQVKVFDRNIKDGISLNK